MKQTSKRFVSTALALSFLIAAFVVYVNFIQPTFAEVRQLRNELFTRESALRDQRSAIRQVQSLLMTYQQDSALVEAVSFALPDTEHSTVAAAQLKALAQNTGLTLKSAGITVGSVPLQGKIGTGQAGLLLVRPLGTLLFNMRLQGTYADFKNFLRAVETNVRVFDVNTVSIQTNYGATAKNYGVNEYSLQAVAYFQKPAVQDLTSGKK